MAENYQRSKRASAFHIARQSITKNYATFYSKITAIPTPTNTVEVTVVVTVAGAPTRPTVEIFRYLQGNGTCHRQAPSERQPFQITTNKNYPYSAVTIKQPCITRTRTRVCAVNPASLNHAPCIRIAVFFDRNSGYIPTVNQRSGCAVLAFTELSCAEGVAGVTGVALRNIFDVLGMTASYMC